MGFGISGLGVLGLWLGRGMRYIPTEDVLHHTYCTHQIRRFGGRRCFRCDKRLHYFLFGRAGSRNGIVWFENGGEGTCLDNLET